MGGISVSDNEFCSSGGGSRGRAGVTRRAFVASAALIALLPRVSAAKAAAIGVTEVAPGIFVHQGRHALVNPENAGDIANAAMVVGADAVAVIDTSSSAKLGAAIRDAVSAITAKPVRYVINTHMHPDHVLGNAAFVASGTEFVAHHKMARGLSARADRYLRNARQAIGDAAFDGTRIVMPTMPVTDKLTLDLGGRTLTLTARATAHTDNDLTILDSATGTLFLGDLLFSGHVPTLDGSILGWLKLIAILKSESAARVVPGHGPPSMPWPDALAPLERYLQTVTDDVRVAIKAGKTMTDATATAGQSEKTTWELFDEHHVRNVTAAFAELEWE